MENKIIDIGKLFLDFVKEKVDSHPEITPHKLNHMLNDLYSEWETSPSAKLDGKTPKEFLQGINSPETLMEMLKLNAESGDIEGLLVDRIAELPECASLLTDVIRESDNDDLVLTCIEILREYESTPPVEMYLDILSSDKDNEIKEAVIESLKEKAADAAPAIYARLDDADESLQTVYAEILLEAPKDDRTYNLLVRLFSLGDNLALYSQYLGKYGDERCAGILYRALDNCKYADFIEIKNAIERLGGIVDDELRDFSEDETYIKIKNSGRFDPKE